MKKRHSGPQIVAKLRQADVLIGQGKNVPGVCKEIEVSEQTYYRCRHDFWLGRPQFAQPSFRCICLAIFPRIDNCISSAVSSRKISQAVTLAYCGNDLRWLHKHYC